MKQERGANQRFWFRKRAIPVFPHRVITVKEIWGTGEGNSSEYTQTITYPSHPGAYLIVTCKEFKQVLEEQCFAHLRTIAKDAAITKEDEVLAAVDSKKEAVTYSASRLVNYEDDILYLTVGLDFFTVPEHKILVPFASIKRLMMPLDRFTAMLWHGDLKYEIILQTLTALEQILVIDFPELTLPSGYMEHISGPHRIYTVAGQLEFFPWFSLDPPRSIEPFHGSQYDDDHSARFLEWVLDTLDEGGSGPHRGVAFDAEAFSNFLDVKIYHVDASKCRVGPNLLVQDQDRYEFSRVDRKWYSTSTGLAAVLDNEDY